MSAISQAIAAMYSGSQVPVKKIALGLHFDGTSGTSSFVDVSGKTVSVGAGTILLTSAYCAPLTGNTISGIFNGTGYLTTPNHSDFDFGSGDFSVGMWVRPRVYGIARALFGKSVASTYGPIAAYVDTAGYVHFSCSQTGTSWAVSITSTVAVALGTFTHVYCSRVGNIFTVYINGVACGMASASGALMTNTAAFIIGGNTGGDYSDGCIDDFVLCTGVAEYTTAFSVPTVPFL